jgi:hypothetical protein
MSLGEDGIILCSFCWGTGDKIWSVGRVKSDESARRYWSNGESNQDIRIILNCIIYSEIFSYIISGYVLILFFYLLTYLLTYFTYSMEQSPSWEANRFSDIQEIHCILLKPNILHRVYKCTPPVPILSQIDPVHTPHPTSWRFILILFYYLILGLPSALFPSSFPTKTPYTPLLSLIVATCPAHLILLNLITQIIFGVDCRILSPPYLVYTNPLLPRPS